MRNRFQSRLVVIACLLGLIVVDAAKLFYDLDPNIIEVTGKSGYFETSTNHRIVEFYNPFCGHCMKFKKKFREVVKEVQLKYPSTEAYGVSCISNNDMCRKFEIDGYPSVFVIPENMPVSKWTEITDFSVQSVEKALFTIAKTGSKKSVTNRDPAAPERELEDSNSNRHSGNDKTPDPIAEGTHFSSVRGSIPMRGAKAAANMDKAMDRWKEIHRENLARKHQKMRRKAPQQPPANNATQIMLANRVNTTEFLKRVKDIENKINSYNGKKNNQVAMEQVRKGVAPYKKVPTKAGIAEKMPIIKHLVKMSDEEQLILDATLSFLTGMRNGVFKTNDVLSPEKQHALREFLNVMSVGLPPEWGIHDTIDSLIVNFETIVTGVDNLNDVLNLHPFPRKDWGPTCSKSSNPFTCGFWKLLHVMTVGIAEQRGGMDSPPPQNRPIISPARAAEAIKGYMDNFFFCSSCTEHFLEKYNDCEMLRRCARLTNSAVDATDADWKELAKWLWEFHNVVSVDILRADKTSNTLVDEVKVIWPTLDRCILCFNDDGTFNEEVVFLMLEKTYWPGHDLNETPRKLLSFDDDNGDFKVGFFLWIVCFSIVYAVSLLVTKTSVQESVIRAKALMMSIQKGGKVRVV